MPVTRTLPLLYVVRHGQTAWNAEHRLQGQADTDLNETGKLQASHNGRALAGLLGAAEDFDFVASPMRRTRQTMERVRTAMGLDPAAYRTDLRLKELHFGDWQGYTYADLEIRSPGSAARRDLDKWNFLPPGKDAESYAMLAARVGTWLDEVAGPSVCVAHGGVVRALFRLVGGLDEADCANLDVPQDRILRIEGRGIEWMGEGI